MFISQQCTMIVSFLQFKYIWNAVLLNFAFDIYHEKQSVKALRAATQRLQKLPINFCIEKLTPLPKEIMDTF